MRRRRKIILLLICMVALLAALFPYGLERYTLWRSAPENVVLISVDTLRADHLHCYGYHRETSPVLDRLAREGAMFRQAVSSTSWTIPAHMALFTSQYNGVHAVVDYNDRLDEKRKTIAESLKEEGFVTAGFYSATVLNPSLGFDQGFDYYINCSSVAEKVNMFLNENAPGGIEDFDPDQTEDLLEKFREREDLWNLCRFDVTGPRIVKKVRDWLDKHKGERFFLFIHFWDPHFHYFPPPPFDTMFDPGYSGEMTGQNELMHPDMDPRDLEHVVALYDGEIRWTDKNIGLVLAKLEEMGVYDRTMVIVTSDHGEEFYEHGNKGHGKTLYEESVMVPLIFRHPGIIPSEGVISRQVRTIDVAPTILDALGLAKNPEAMGKSLLGLMRKGRGKERSAFMSLMWKGMSLLGLRTGRGKLVHDMKAGFFECYDLENDPGETGSLHLKNPLCNPLLEKFYVESENIVHIRNSIPHSVEQPDVEINPFFREQLRALGYIDE